MKLRIAIVDDERIARQRLRRLLAREAETEARQPQVADQDLDPEQPEHEQQALVAQAWDVAGLAARYEGFVAEFAAM